MALTEQEIGHALWQNCGQLTGDQVRELVAAAVAIGVERERARIKEDSPIFDWIERKHGDLMWSNGGRAKEPYAGHPGMTRQTGRTAREAFHRAMRIDP
jgi:hypothetical protein